MEAAAGGPGALLGLSRRDMIMAPVYILLWVGVSNSLVLLNRHILVELDFRFPVLLTSLGQVFSLAATVLLRATTNFVPPREDVTPEFWTTRVLPIGLFSCGTLALGQFPYYTLSVSFIQMLKAFTPVMTLICLLAFRMEKFSWPLVTSVAVIAAGTAIASLGEVQFAWEGFLYMMGSEVCESLKLVATQMLLQGLSFKPLQSLLYLTPATILFLVMLGLVSESGQYSSKALPIVLGNPGLFLLAASLGFGVNLTTMGVVKILSSLWLKIFVQVKGALLMLLSVLLLGEVITSVQLVGYSVCLLGFAFYTRLKQRIALQSCARKTENGPSSDAAGGV